MLEKFLESNSKINSSSEPLIFDLSKEKDFHDLDKIVGSGAIAHVCDDFLNQLNEFFQVENPTLVFSPELGEKFNAYLDILTKDQPLWKLGRWVYYPWISTIVHILEDEAFQKVRTARNKNLINAQEQGKFYNSTIGIAGQSVGNNVVLSIVLQGGGKHLKLADFDRLSLSNTNRIRSGVDNLGLLKVEMTARQVYLLNPYAKIELYSDGLTEKNIESFFDGLDIVVDEIDNLALKHLIRQNAKKFKLPVVMGADNGDNAVIDIERYDLDSSLPFFHGRIGDIGYNELKGLDKMGIGKKIVMHIGPENVTKRVQESMMEIGKTIVSWPQLGGAALLNGSAVAYCVRKILNGQSVESNRALVSLDEKLIPEYLDKNNFEARAKDAVNFSKIFGL